MQFLLQESNDAFSRDLDEISCSNLASLNTQQISTHLTPWHSQHVRKHWIHLTGLAIHTLQPDHSQPKYSCMHDDIGDLAQFVADTKGHSCN